jgi:hypothetical protein
MKELFFVIEKSIRMLEAVNFWLMEIRNSSAVGGINLIARNLHCKVLKIHLFSKPIYSPSKQLL